MRAFLSWMVPWRNEPEATDEALRADLVLGISGTLGTLGAIFAVLLSLDAMAHPSLAVLCAASAIIHGTNLALIRRRAWAGIARWAVSLEVLALLGITASLTTGYRAFGLGWLLLAPLVAMFLLGVRNGVIFGALLGVEAVTLWYFESHGLFYPPGAHADVPAGIDLINSASMMLMVLGIGYSYERAHELRRKALAEKIDQLNEAHAALSGAQQQLVASEKLSSLGLLAAGVAHEINNPMAFITSNVIGLGRDLEDLLTDEELRREYVTDVIPATIDGIQRVNAIVSDLRRFARGDPESFVEYDLNAEISAAMRIAHGQVASRQAKLDVALGTLPPVRGLPRQIMQVVMNLIVNAAQAGKTGGHIEVSSWATADHVAVKVKDDGSGMGPETISKLFQPFFTTKSVGEGTGLGLAVVHGIVKAHSGRIEVESQLGKGSAFTVWLPHAPTPRFNEAPRP
jgi:signal transduction histidine kinase